MWEGERRRERERERGKSVWDMREEEREEKVFGIGGRKTETVGERKSVCEKGREEYRDRETPG